MKLQANCIHCGDTVTAKWPVYRYYPWLSDRNPEGYQHFHEVDVLMQLQAGIRRDKDKRRLKYVQAFVIGLNIANLTWIVGKWMGWWS